MELNIIVHGRSASTLLARMLMGTRQFTLWGDRNFACELKTFKQPGTWRCDYISSALEPFKGGHRILAKLPEFQYFLELLFPFGARVLVNERSAIEKLRSLIEIGWDFRAYERYEEKKLVKRATFDFLTHGGTANILARSHTVKAFLVLAWGNWRVRQKLDLYSGDYLFLSFDELMMRPHDAYARLDGFYGFEHGAFWDKWDKMRSKRHQKSGRDLEDSSAFATPYEAKFKPRQLKTFSNILKIFR